MFEQILEVMPDGYGYYLAGATCAAIIVLNIFDRKKAQQLIKGAITIIALFIAAMVVYTIYIKAQSEGDFERLRKGDQEKESSNPRYYQDLDKKYNLDQQ
ncbi:MAG: hypothetical protein OEY01_02740 [Desulfobulbaceae bacterium]|nr:hypothetical protein [Desulfobulbaceae bacterium]HIJ78209.1 hypothetical protein [Deltaproteobacteria bacterium]